ncbi:MAG TPA: multicopper oxidase domain-containing protein [Gemmatimonadaceae bacterium]|jgi:FtsP/CotA-like multicopper oxidase with cupredoxin domain
MQPRSSLIAATCAIIALSNNASSQVRERVRSNDNRARAGILSGNVLALRMEARIAEWHPQGDDAPGVAIPVFAEIGRQASVPGPLIRVPAGTTVITVVRNAVPNTVLTVHGLHSRPVVGAAFNDSIQLTYGQIQTLRFKLDRPGTYYYWGTTTNSAFGTRTGLDAQLTGAIVVDEAGERASKDRIFVIGMWADSAGTELNRHRIRELFVINGRSWPYTDRLSYERGDTVRWRVINASTDVHPMHLHGFYFKVRRRGDGREDFAYGARGDLVNTERVLPGGTMYATWTADRLGNWLFHCHIPEHFAVRGPLGFPPPVALSQAGRIHPGNMSTDMGGLVMAIEVKPAEDDTTALAPTITAAQPAARRLRLIMRSNIGSTPPTPYYGVVFDSLGIEPPADSGQHVGPPLVLTRGEPVSITVINRTPEPSSVHWHGIELESYFDGVPGFSGMKPQLAPLIAPADSFEVRFTPPRSGTFIYHTHVNEKRQHRAGLAGPLLVVEKGKYDPSKDVTVIVSSPSDSVEEERSVLINGRLNSTTIDLRRGMASRIRIINITIGRPGLRMELRQDTALVNWRPLAKDGADIPSADRTLRKGTQTLSIGETMDVEFSPMRPGEYRLEAKSTLGALLGTVLIRVN